MINAKQWRTRVLYNAFPPFKYNYVIDTHVFPCDSKAVGELFANFKESGVDLSYGNRHYDPNRIMGSGILFKHTERMKRVWLHTYEFMSTKGVNCDQSALYNVLSNESIRNTITIKLLSFNWNFCMMKINNNGEFNWDEKCYYSSLPVNAKVRFVHGILHQCNIMNGDNDEYVNLTRILFQPGKCNTTERNARVIVSEDDFEKAVYPYNKTRVSWQKFSKLPNNSIFWPYRDFCKD